MNTATKLLTAMRQNPNDWAMAKLLTVAKQYNMEVRSTGGSHHVFFASFGARPAFCTGSSAHQGLLR